MSNAKPPTPNQLQKQIFPEKEVLEIQKQTVIIENEGFGRFEYSDGTVYEGQWRLNSSNVKVKHGEGELIHAGATSHEKGNEEYSGTWNDDKMEGIGTYKYTSGAIYTGEWKDGKQHGKV